ncbi:MAG: ectoine/hydroxyectoine ABC transporter substrate-binding protein EhuB [Desulfitibacter sp. BRH_c19]|nr:MAG: ectoine/hydroxyectoine ABC transporter substrate-binding protein EhuB [Desulfitibacter sp. BRH_c19]
MLVFLMVLVLTLMIGITGCGTDTATEPETPEETEVVQETEETTFERVQREGYVTVGFANEAPFAYATPAGQLTGQNVEIARAVLKRLGIDEMDGVLTEFGSLIPGLKANRFDMITAGMYITPDRAKEVAFADPEYTIGGALAVKAGNPYGLSSYEDIAANPEVKVAVMAGGQEYEYMIAAGVSADQLLTVSDQPSCLAALQAERVDAITMTGPALQSMLDTVNDPKVERVEDFVVSVIDGVRQQGFGSTAFRMEDQDFLAAYNRELQNIKDSGELLEIQKSFGFTESEFVDGLTAEDVIAN